MRRSILIALLALASAGFTGQSPVDRAVRSITAEEIRAHTAFLADDMLQGRAPGTRGGDLAARYIAAQFARSGVRPVHGSYFQQVPLRAWRADPSSTTVDVQIRGERRMLRYPDDVVVWPGAGADVAIEADVVFVGYGVRAPEYHWDDYKGRDVRGRVVAVLINDPPAPPTDPLLFDGRAMTYYGRWSYKIEEARRQGAAGILLIHDDLRAGYGWDVVRTSWTGEVLGLEPRPEDRLLAMEGWITAAAAARMFGDAGHDMAELMALAARRDFAPVATGITLRATLHGASRSFQSPNVVGVVPGSHAERRDEVVVYTAHYDHLGIGQSVAGDSIHNGAYDNASGVAALLEIAEAFALLEPGLERSVLFIATTAEEAGLLGATYYTRQPLFPLNRTIAALNIDGANLWGETHDVLVLGGDRSTIGRFAEARARSMELALEFERAPERGYFYRSDHFAFARRGVPAAAIDHGVRFRDRPDGWGERVLSRFDTQHYHKPSDRLDPRADLGGAVQQAAFAFLLGLDILQSVDPPRLVTR
jgi:Zn-dependent M28 family amino/carboxypeptidase